MVHRPSHREEQIRQAIDVADEQRIDRRGQRHDASFGATAHGSSDMQRGADRDAARQDEMRKRLNFRIEAIDQALKTGDVGVGQEGLGEALG